MSTKDAYQQKMEARLAEVNAEIDQLRARADRASADARIEYQEQVKELKALQQRAQVKLGEIRTASDDAWEDVKEGADSAWASLNSAAKRASSRFA